MADVRKPLEFIDITNEQWRVYRFPDGVQVRLDAPMRLHIDPSGAHRIQTADGRAHLIPYGWIHLQWMAKQGADPFTF